MTQQHPGLAGRPVYLDYNATTPVDPAVFEVMTPFLTSEFGNPSSTHPYGRPARAALEQARDHLRDLLSATSGRIVFTGSGSEADALAIRGTVLASVAAGRRRPHAVTQVTEHPAVLAACRHLEQFHGATVTYLPVDGSGLVHPDQVREAITADTVLVSIMHANNETGTLMPIPAIAEAAREWGVLLHCDAAQSIGKVDVAVDDLGADLLTVVGHKMYAPKGIAALYVRDGVPLVPLIGGGGQEHGLRAGTENVPYAVGLGRAAQLAAAALAAGETGRLTALRDELQAALEQRLPGRIRLNGHTTLRLPNTLNISIDGSPALRLLAATTAVAASAGSACHAGLDEPSPVLTAMGIPTAAALTAVRLSLGRWTRGADIEQATVEIAEHAYSPSPRRPGGRT